MCPQQAHDAPASAPPPQDLPQQHATNGPPSPMALDPFDPRDGALDMEGWDPACLAGLWDEAAELPPLGPPSLPPGQRDPQAGPGMGGPTALAPSPHPPAPPSGLKRKRKNTSSIFKGTSTLSSLPFFLPFVFRLGFIAPPRRLVLPFFSISLLTDVVGVRCVAGRSSAKVLEDQHHST
jgi:hypothetical protein